MHNRITQTIDNFAKQINQGIWGSHTNPILKHGIELLECLDTNSIQLRVEQQQELHDVIVIGTALNALSRDLDKYRNGFNVTEHYGYRGDYGLTWEGLRVISHVRLAEMNPEGGLFHTGTKKLILAIGFKALIDKDTALPDVNHFFQSDGIAAKLVFDNILIEQLAKYDKYYIKMNLDFNQAAFIRESTLLKISKKPAELTKFVNNSIKIAVGTGAVDRQEVNSIISENSKIELLKGEFESLNFNLAKCFLQMGRGKREWLLKGHGYILKQQSLFPVAIYAQITAYVFGLSDADTTKIIHAVQQRLKDRLAGTFFEKYVQQNQQEHLDSFSLLRRRK